MKILKINRFKLTIDLDLNNSYCLCIENKKHLFSFVSHLLNDEFETEMFITDINNKEYNLIDHIDFILNLFNLELNTKKNLNALYRIFKRSYATNLSSFTASITNQIDEFIKNLLIDFQIECTTDTIFKEDDVLKLSCLRIKEYENSPIQNLLEAIKTAIELRKIKVFIVYKLSDYFSDEEISLIVKNCKYLDVILINIESTQSTNNAFDYTIIMDEDLCLLDNIVYNK